MNRNVIIILLITPILLIIQFVMGFVVYQKVQLINTSRKLEGDERDYLRNNLLSLLLAETSQRVYLLSGDSSSFKTYEESLQNIISNKAPALFLKERGFNEIPRLTKERVNSLAINIRFLSEGKNDSILPMMRSGALLRDSIKVMNEKYYAIMDKRFETIEKNETRWIEILVPISIFIFAFNLLHVFLSIRKIRLEIQNITELNQNLTARNKQLRLFTFMTYHSLKEPLRHISGFLQLLKRKYLYMLDEEGKGYIQMSVNATKKMASMISELREKHLQKNGEDNPTEEGF